MKQIAAIMLCMGFFMPLSQCSHIEGSVNPNHSSVILSAYSAYDWPSVGAFIALILFFWPLLVQGVALYRRFNIRWHVPFFVELTMCVLTALGISWFVLWGESIRFGAFVAYSAIGSYGAALLVEGKSNRSKFRLDTDASRRST